MVGETEEGKSLWTADPFSHLRHAIEPMAKGVHRLLVPLYDKNSFDVHQDIFPEKFQLCTQTDVLGFILCHSADFDVNQIMSLNVETAIHKYKSRHDDPLYEKLLKNEAHIVEKTDEKELVYHAFKRMAELNISAIAVVDEEHDGILIGTLSVSDLRFVSSKAEIEPLIKEMATMSIKDFLLRVKKQPVSGINSLITCKPNDSVRATINNALENKVHRVWCIDEQERPLHVVTFTDMIRWFLH